MRSEIENGYKVKEDERIEDYIVNELSSIEYKLDYLINIIDKELKKRE